MSDGGREAGRGSSEGGERLRAAAAAADCGRAGAERADGRGCTAGEDRLRRAAADGGRAAAAREDGRGHSAGEELLRRPASDGGRAKEPEPELERELGHRVYATELWLDSSGVQGDVGAAGADSLGVCTSLGLAYLREDMGTGNHGQRGFLPANGYSSEPGRGGGLFAPDRGL